MHKHLSAFFVAFFVVFSLFGCQENSETDIKTEEPTELPTFDYTKLDGVYHLIQSFNLRMNTKNAYPIEAPYSEYEMVISGLGFTETYTLYGTNFSESHTFTVNNDSLSVDSDERSFYFNIEKGIIEITVYSITSNDTYHVILAKDKEIELSQSGLSGYYMLESVEGEVNGYMLNNSYFGEFTLDFTIDGEVTLLMQEASPSVNVKMGTYLYTDRMVLLSFEDQDLIFLMDDEGYLNFLKASYFPVKVYHAKLSHQEDREHPVYTIYEHLNYDYSNSDILKDELEADLISASLNFEVNHSFVELYQGLAHENMFVYLIQDGNLIVADHDQVLYVKDYVNATTALVITEYYSIGASFDMDIPSYNLFEILDDNYEVTKDKDDHYWIKVPYEVLKESRFLFTKPYLFFNTNQNYAGDLFIQVVFDENQMGYVLYDEHMKELGVVAFSYEMDEQYGIDFDDIKQDIAYSMETAIIPMKTDEWYSVSKDAYLPYENYYLLELEEGAYEVIHTPEYAADIELLDAEGNSLYYMKKHFSAVEDRFAFDASRDQTYYLKVRSYSSYIPGYDVMIKKIDSLNPTVLDIEMGTSYHLETDSIFNYYAIELTSSFPQGYHVVFIPDEGEKVYIDITRFATIGTSDAIDEYIMMDSGETFVVEVRSSGTLMIEKVEDDSYGASDDNPYSLNDVTDEVFVASIHYPDDVFTYTHTSGAFTLEIDQLIEYDVYDEFGVKKSLPIELPGTYKVVTHVPYLFYYGTYHIHASALLTETYAITELDYTYQGYALRNYDQRFSFTIDEKSLIEIEVDREYGMSLLGPDGRLLIGDFDHYQFTLLPGTYTIVFSSTELTSFTLTYKNHGLSTKPAINDDVKSIPMSETLIFDQDYEIYMFAFELQEDEFIRVIGDAYFGRYTGSSYMDELNIGINYGFGAGSIRILVMKKEVSNVPIQILERS